MRAFQRARSEPTSPIDEPPCVTGATKLAAFLRVSTMAERAAERKRFEATIPEPDRWLAGLVCWSSRVEMVEDVRRGPTGVTRSVEHFHDRRGKLRVIRHGGPGGWIEQVAYPGQSDTVSKTWMMPPPRPTSGTPDEVRDRHVSPAKFNGYR